MIVDRQRSLKRVVDILCLDQTGGLVLLEIKNEASTRLGLGQALEYLGATQDLTLEDLADEFDGDLQEALAATFDRPPSAVSSRRRVFLVAPAFDAPSVMATRFVDSVVRHAGIEVGLLRVEGAISEFKVESYQGATFTRARSLPPGLAVSPKGRLFYVLESGRQPVIWHVGRPDQQGRIRPPRSRAKTRRSIRVRNSYMLPQEDHPAVSMHLRDSTWRHRSRIGWRAKVVGCVTADTGPAVVFAQFNNDEFRRFKIEPQDRFDRDWVRETLDLPGWREIADLAEAGSKSRREAVDSSEEPPR